jgi:hypothetical protein
MWPDMTGRQLLPRLVALTRNAANHRRIHAAISQHGMESHWYKMNTGEREGASQALQTADRDLTVKAEKRGKQSKDRMHRQSCP